MHSEAFAFVASRLVELPPRERVVEFGSRDINGSIRALFDAAESYIAVDLLDGRGVDVVADAALYTPPAAVDTVVSCELLEHTPKGREILANAFRILAPGGVLILTCATDPRAPHSGLDGDLVREGEYYGNVDPDELRGWLGRFEAVEIEVHARRGDLYATARKPRRVRAKRAAA